MIITANKHREDVEFRRSARTHEMQKKKKKRHWVLTRKVMCGGDMDNVAG